MSCSPVRCACSWIPLTSGRCCIHDSHLGTRCIHAAPWCWPWRECLHQRNGQMPRVTTFKKKTLISWSQCSSSPPGFTSNTPELPQTDGISGKLYQVSSDEERRPPWFQRGLRARFWIHVFQSGPDFHPSIYLWNQILCFGLKGWRCTSGNEEMESKGKCIPWKWTRAAAVGRYEPNPAVWDEPSSHRDEERRGAFKDVQQWQEGKHHSSWGTSPGLRTAQTFPGI